MRRICCARAALLVLTTLPAWADSVEDLLENARVGFIERVEHLAQRRALKRQPAHSPS